jgi:hypothetical protein
MDAYEKEAHMASSKIRNMLGCADATLVRIQVTAGGGFVSSIAKVVDKAGTRTLASNTLQTPAGGSVSIRSLPTVVTLFMDYLGQGSNTVSALATVTAEGPNGAIKSTAFNEDGQPGDEDIVVDVVRA